MEQGSDKERAGFPEGKFPQIITVQVVMLIARAIFGQEKEKLKI